MNNDCQINLGSGQRKFSSPWINVDVQAKWTPDIISDGVSMPMFADNSAKTIVMHHVLEHFGCNEADHVIRECYRILAPGGSLIVTVPDIPNLMKGFFQDRINLQVLMTNLYGAYMGDEADRHKWGYGSLSLYQYLFQCAPWKKAITFDHREIPGADIAKDWWILGMEAIK
jgi:SAM-dependent methyltransferase